MEMIVCVGEALLHGSMDTAVVTAGLSSCTPPCMYFDMLVILMSAREGDLIEGLWDCVRENYTWDDDAKGVAMVRGEQAAILFVSQNDVRGRIQCLVPLHAGPVAAIAACNTATHAHSVLMMCGPKFDTTHLLYNPPFRIRAREFGLHSHNNLLQDVHLQCMEALSLTLPAGNSYSTYSGSQFNGRTLAY